MKTFVSALLPLALILGASGVAAQSGKVNDAQIAGIVVAANTVDIEAGKLARSRAVDKDVQAFADLMVTDHTGVNKQAGALVKKLGVKPEDSDTSKSLMRDGEATRDRLKKLKGKDFERAYIDNEVKYHQAVIDALDKTLIPSAANAELKALLVKVRPAFVAHLEHAKSMQSSR